MIRKINLSLAKLKFRCDIYIYIYIYFIFREEFLAKIERRVKDYKVDILNEPREGKMLLVLDIDYTLFGMYRNAFMDLTVASCVLGYVKGRVSFE